MSSIKNIEAILKFRSPLQDVRSKSSLKEDSSNSINHHFDAILPSIFPFQLA